MALCKGFFKSFIDEVLAGCGQGEEAVMALVESLVEQINSLEDQIQALALENQLS